MKDSKVYAILFAVLVFFMGLIIMWLAFYLSGNPLARDPNIINWKLNIWHQIMLAIAASFLSSVIFYLLYSMVAEKQMLKSVSFEVSKRASEYTLSLFHDRFDRIIPKKIFPPTLFPTKEFNDDFENSLNNSRNYKYKGDTASYTTYRLFQLASKEVIIDKDIKLILLDPRKIDLIEDRVKTELYGQTYSKSDLQEKIEEMQTKIFVTIIALFDICHIIPVKIAFHVDHMFFRSEILDEELFLTYCLGGENPTTHLYLKKSLPFEAFNLDFQQTWNSANLIIDLNSKLKEPQILDYLNILKCQLPINELKTLATFRHTQNKVGALEVI
jgi:hypothetical protein